MRLLRSAAPVRTLSLSAALLLVLAVAPQRSLAQTTTPAESAAEATHPEAPAVAPTSVPPDAGTTNGPAARGADWPWAIVGLGGALVIAAAVTGGLTLERQAELDRVCTPHSCPPAAERAQAEGRALAFSTDALGIGGLVIATAGIVLAVALPTDTDRPVTAAATCGPSGCTLTVGGWF